MEGVLGGGILMGFFACAIISSKLLTLDYILADFLGEMGPAVILPIMSPSVCMACFFLFFFTTFLIFEFG